jgi:antitoxin VapB
MSWSSLSASRVVHSETCPFPIRNGTNQAVRLPRAFELDADDVIIRRDGDSLVLTPKPRTWDDYFAQGSRLDPDFPDPREAHPPEEREPL